MLKMVNTQGEIQDLLTDMGDDSIYVEGAYDFEEWTIIDNDDIVIIQALSQCKDSVPEGFGARAPALCDPSNLIDPVVADNLNNTILMLRLADDLDQKLKTAGQ